MDMVLSKQLVIIVGAPRSCTTWLHRMIGAHPAVAALPQELTLFSKYLAPAVRHFSEEAAHRDAGRWEQGLPMLFSEAEFEGGLRSVVEAVYARVLARNPSATHILDKHPHYAGHLPLIGRLLPGCKVLHIIRDGREAASSSMSTKRRIGFGEAAISGAARTWRDRVRKARQDGPALGEGRYLELRFEELKREPASGLESVMSFCGVPASHAEVERIAEEFSMARKPLSRTEKRVDEGDGPPVAMDLRQRYVMDRIAGDLLRELGYAREGWWAQGPADRARAYIWRLRERLVASALGNLTARSDRQRGTGR